MHLHSHDGCRLVTIHDWFWRQEDSNVSQGFEHIPAKPLIWQTSLFLQWESVVQSETILFKI